MAEQLDVEALLIGGCLSNESKLDDLSVTGDDFESPILANIFDRMLQRHRQKLGVSAALLGEDFPDHMDVIWRSTFDIAEMSRTEHYGRAVQERSIRRKLREAAIKIAGWSADAPVDDLMDLCRAEVDGALSMRETRVTSMQDDIHDVLAAHRQVSAAHPSPWPELNEVMRGFIAGRLYIVGARPAVGKSAFAAQIAYELAQHGSVLFATMEMEKGEVYDRIIAQQAEIYYGGLSDGDSPEFLREKERAWLERGLRDIRVLDQGTQTVQSIRAAARSAMRDGPVAGIVVDYIHLLTGSNGTSENETARIGEITRALKQMAMDLKVPVIALSQLNRAVTSRAEGKPTLADLRGSGSIEQDGDVAIFLYKDTDSEGEFMNNILRVFVAKNRQGPAHVDIDLEWQGEFVRAVSRD